MKRRCISLFLTVILLFSFLPALSPSAQADDICFIAINDTLLDLNSAPYYLGGTYYIPYWIFTNFRIYYNSFGNTGTVSLFTQDRQIFFDMTNGVTFDSNNTPYNAQAVYSGGQVYLPAYFLCSYFGLNCTFISGNGYGDILRITDGSEILSNSVFLAAAKTLMVSRYEDYLSGKNPNENGSDNSNLTEDKTNNESRSDTAVYISFHGLPTENMLRSLERFNVSACFFVTSSEIIDSPDKLRQALGYGHSIGILCGRNAQADYDSAASVLYETAMLKTLLVASTTGNENSVRSMAEANGLVYRSTGTGMGNDGSGVSRAEDITSVMEISIGYADICLPSNETTEHILPAILQYLTEQEFDLRIPREIDNSFN
ncbi:MAG: hypothetical protein Q4A39_03265 [Eubacteriales bacterium]|nr:hypothetical protein [Eubacteriales bacterium]